MNQIRLINYFLSTEVTPGCSGICLYIGDYKNSSMVDLRRPDKPSYVSALARFTSHKKP